ncbi:MAG TPA: hypothetical protein V6C65_32875 [Allocoleopsis sp.]
MEPLVICEQFVSRFKFWSDGQVQDGMQHRHELFRCLRAETVKGRQQIFDLAWALSHEGVHIIITASKEHYTLWVNLRSLAKLDSLSTLSELEPEAAPDVNPNLLCRASA